MPGPKIGTTRTATFHGSLAEARAERRRLLAAGRPAPPREAAVITLNDLAARVFQARSVTWAANTLRNREDDYVRRLAPAIGEFVLSDLDRRRVEEWLASLIGSGASRRMIVQTVATLRVILATGVEWGLIDGNPARGLRLPRPDHSVPSPAHRVISRVELDRLVAAAGTLRTEALLRLVGETGLRRAEVAGLRWDDIDLEARRLRVRRQIVHERLSSGGHRKVVTSPKSGRERRVALTPRLVDLLSRWKESAADPGPRPDAYVWPGQDGGPMHDRSLARALERACVRSGLVDDRGKPRLSPHRLRHSAASIMLRERVPITVVAAQLGHADPAITARIYAHLVEDRDLDMAADAFGEGAASTG
ncbi:MAG: tyrosine-type recombinase/integrase [Thermoleophilia bacterium]